MLKTKIILNKDKIEKEGKSYIEYKTQLIGIMVDMKMKKEDSGFYIMSPEDNSIGAGALLLNRLKLSGLIHYLKEWKIYCDEESDDDSMEESDMLALCIKRGLING